MAKLVMRIILVLLAYSCCSTIPSAADFDYFKLVLMWPNSFCSQHITCQKKPQKFTVHGLWPDNYTTQLTYCPGPKDGQYNVKFILTRHNNDLANKLDTFWPDLTKPHYYYYHQHRRHRRHPPPPPPHPATNFWAYEWKKHGSCASPVYTVARYFDKAMDLSKRFDVLNILRKAKIYPGHKVAMTKLNQAIFDATLHNPILKCLENGDLLEVIICLDNKGNNVIDCPKTGQSCMMNPDVFIPRM